MAQRRGHEWPRPWDDPADPTDWVEESKRLGPEAPWRQRERERERQEHRAHLLRFFVVVGILTMIVGIPIAAAIAWGGEAAGGAVALEGGLASLALAILAIWTMTE